MFKNPFSFEGRIRRTEYGITLIIFTIIGSFISTVITENQGDAIILALIYVPLLWVLWAQSAKRCHDVGNSGWWQLIPLYRFWLVFQEGQQGVNQYGENPKGLNNNQRNYSGNQNQTNYNNNQGGYQGGYNGGHNNQNSNYNSSDNQYNNNNQGGEYKDGDLYN